MTEQAGLQLLRKPFQPHQLSKLPKPTKKQTEEVRQDFRKGIRCPVCGAWHHKDVVHLDYVGHAALTDRLLDCDPEWNWQPLAATDAGTPLMDENGGMWIILTVCGVARIGYGHPDGKRGGDAIKEIIGDALRNAAMRFGAALDLWHKGDLHAHDDDVAAGGGSSDQPTKPPASQQRPATPAQADAPTDDAMPPAYEIKTAKGRFQRLTVDDWANACIKMLRQMAANAAYEWRDMNADTIQRLYAGTPPEKKAVERVMAEWNATQQPPDGQESDLATALNDSIPF